LFDVGVTTNAISTIAAHCFRAQPLTTPRDGAMIAAGVPPDNGSALAPFVDGWLD
jgi:hypothetical protein